MTPYPCDIIMQKFIFRYYSKSFKESESFIKNLFIGRVKTSQIYPYPQILNNEQKDVLHALVTPTQKFFKEINNPALNDKLEKVEDRVMNELKSMGAFGLQVPENLNGLGLTNSQYARMVECVGEGLDMGVGITLGAHQSIGFKAILLYGTDEQKAKYLPDLAHGKTIAAFCLTEPGSGSDAASIQTIATPIRNDDSGHITSFRLKGSKIWISNGGIAEIFTVFARVPGCSTSKHNFLNHKLPTNLAEEKNVTNSYKDICAFIVERKFGGVTNGKPEKKMGIKASNTAEVYFDDVIVPVENLIGRPGQGFKIAMSVLNNGRFGMGAALAGLSRAVITASAQFARNRVQFEGKPIASYGAIQEKLARMSAKQYALESISYALAGIMDQEKMDEKSFNATKMTTADNTGDYQLEAAVVKMLASEFAWYIVDEAIQIHGGNGFMTSTGLERVLRDLRIFRIFEGTSEILKVFIGLGGLQYAGSYLMNMQKVMKNPFGNFSLLLPELKKWLRYPLNLPLQTFQDSFNKVHVSLLHENFTSLPQNAVNIVRQCQRTLLRDATQFAFFAQYYLLVKGNGRALVKEPFTHDEFSLIRFAEAASLLFTATTCLSRLVMSLQKNYPTAPLELKLVQVFCMDAHEDIQRALLQIKENAIDKSVKSDDGGKFFLYKQISDHVTENEQLVTTHPLH